MRTIINFDEEGPMRLLDIAAGDEDLDDEVIGDIYESLSLFYAQQVSLYDFVRLWDRHMGHKYIIETNQYPDVLAASSIDGEVLDKVIEKE